MSDTMNRDYWERETNGKFNNGIPNTSGSTAGMPASARQYMEEQKKKSVKYAKDGGNSMPSDVAIIQDDINAAKQGKQNATKSSSSSSSKKKSNLAVGDKVQVKDGATDVTTGKKAKKGKNYGEGGPKWAKITSITENYPTGSKWGLPAKVTKVQCSDNNTVVWQVADTDIASQSIKPDQIDTKPMIGAAGGRIGAANDVDTNKKRKVTSAKYTIDEKVRRDSNVGSSAGPYTPDGSSDKWYEGFTSESMKDLNDEVEQELEEEGYVSDSFYDGNKISGTYIPISSPNVSDHQLYNDPQYELLLIRNGYNKKEAEAIMKRQRKLGKSSAGLHTGAVEMLEFNTSWSNSNRRSELLNDNEELIQNNKSFPTKVRDASYGSADKLTGETYSDPKSAKYDYQIILDDPRLKGFPNKRSFEDRLAEARAMLGLPVHGDPGLAKYMKMYMYNRYKTPDTNLALTKTFTYVFFTRPDLNIMDGGSNANWQSRNHTDSALIWKTHPELFKLLTDYRRCGDPDNFNLLLSNNVLSFTIDDEKLATNRAGKSWAEHEITYGEQYTGRTAGEFNCTFTETSNLDIITLNKLWITYIDNVGRGAWSPYYFTKDGGRTVKNKKTSWCHVYDRALDYAASAYVFKCGADGEEILYWSKYYGVFPITTGSSMLSLNDGAPIGDVGKVNITFAYSCKKDLSPISLLEFNNASNVTESTEWMPGFTSKMAGSSRPYVGSPYIEIDLGTPTMKGGDVDRGSKETKLRLKFKKPPYSTLTGNDKMASGDNLFFKNNYGNVTIDGKAMTMEEVIDYNRTAYANEEYD